MFKSVRLFSLLFLGLALTLQAGCDPNGFDLDTGSNRSPEQSDTNHSNGVANGSIGGSAKGVNGHLQSVQTPQLIIGSFNIQRFGKSKMSKPAVVEILTDVVRRHDILAIQELVDIDQVVIPAFLNLINADGSRYAAAVGPRQGFIDPGKTKTNYEQSVFIYDTNSVELLGPTYAAYDRYRLMHRPPFVGHFRCLEARPNQAFSFVLLNVHIDPDDKHFEFKALQEIIGEVYANHRGEDDFILLGDMNEAPHKYQKYQWMRNQRPMLPPEFKTNTVGNKAYDNLVFDAGYTAEFRDHAGVMNLMDVYQLTLSQAQLVSDHFPVWGVFSVQESPRAALTQGDQNEAIQ